jgi:hypothetical protein
MKISELKEAIREMIVSELNEVDMGQVTTDDSTKAAELARKGINVLIPEDDVNEMAFLKGPKSPEGLEAAITAVIKSNSDAELSDIKKAIRTDEKVIKALEKVKMNVKDDLADNQLNKFIELIRGNRVIGKLGRPADPNKPAKEPKEPGMRGRPKSANPAAKKKDEKQKAFSMAKKYYVDKTKGNNDQEKDAKDSELIAITRSGGEVGNKQVQLRQQERTKLVKTFLKGMKEMGIVDNSNRILDKDKYATEWSKAKIEIEDKVSKLK